ncbi:MAG: hypothetical protein NZM40_08320 [Sphingomonadaceae bacterium]|uniref:type II secretion system protein N n=1 Tax=Thermaurantiacus sp. TaxID=2820283 RepID=UPI00298F34C5|nr:type II secretion system protein N [Thermaurantiacus sp.]MCS6987414.1 hypothetical protein [Sphingomonadaceae bacterium]MDW8415334.1 type II secretion system protein N [Thermaurantiacus sp.]
MNPRLRCALLATLALLPLGAFALWAGQQALASLRQPPPPVALADPAPADPSILARLDPFFRMGPLEGAALPVTALPLSLKGIRLDPASGRGAAFIAGANGPQRPVAPGEEVQPGVTLVAIAADHVVLERDGRRESLWLEAVGRRPAAGPAATPAAATTVAPRDEAPPDDPPPPPEDEEEEP